MACIVANAEQLARRILHHSRRRITQMAPILLECIYALPERVRPTPGPLSTDGTSLWFHPEQVVEDFQRDRDLVARQLLHVTVHCLLGHPEQRSAFDRRKVFDCAADLKVAQFVREVCGDAFATASGEDCKTFPNCPHLRPLYDILTTDTANARALRRVGIRSRLDRHSLWSPPASWVGAEDVCDAAEHPSEGDELGVGQSPPDWDALRQTLLDGMGGKLPGLCAGLLRETLGVSERGLSYEAFLRRFAAPAERLQTDPDYFDPRWYRLGLEYYGNVPLLEPSELSEPPQPDDLVIALDTSASCSGERCRRFLKETLGILRDISAGAARFRVLLLQCDTQIQQEVLLESPQQVEDLFADFQVRGFGGTDFCPVFERVAQLRAQGVLSRVRGLLYFTDGWGHFPSQPTDYPTAFLIPADEAVHRNREADWITRLYLNEEDFTLKEVNAL